MVGGVLSWYNQISYPHIKYVIPQEWDFWAPCQAPQLRGLNRRKMPFGFEAQKGLITGAPQYWVETETPVLEGAHKFLYALGSRAKRVTSYAPGPKVFAGLEGVPGRWGGGKGQQLIIGTRSLVAKVYSGNIHEIFLSLTFWHQDLTPLNSL